MFKTEVDYSVNKKKYNAYSVELEQMVPAGSKVLDIGCSTGKLAQALKLKKCSVVGVDIDDASLHLASKYCKAVHNIDLDNLKQLDEKLKNEKFDVITIGDVLEHLKYPGVLLHHLHRYLKPEGLIAATIPNTGFIWTRFRFLSGNFSYNKNGGLMDEDHLRFFSIKTARLLFEDSNYKVLNIRGAIIGKIKPQYMLLKVLVKIIPTIFAIHILILAQTQGKRG